MLGQYGSLGLVIGNCIPQSFSPINYLFLPHQGAYWFPYTLLKKKKKKHHSHLIKYSTRQYFLSYILPPL